jgi:hypothetical protein
MMERKSIVFSILLTASVDTVDCDINGARNIYILFRRINKLRHFATPENYVL